MLRRLTLLMRFSDKGEKASFGFQQVPIGEKQHKVNEVFHSVASDYDKMNDAMSLGIHRCWKDHFVNQLGVLTSRKGSQNGQPRRVLDVAGGTGDIAFKILQKHKRSQDLKITVLDINQSMLKCGKQRAQKLGYTSDSIQEIIQTYNLFVLMLNNYPLNPILLMLILLHLDQEMSPELLKLLVKLLEYQSEEVTWWPLSDVYKFYSFNIIPMMGELIAKDRKSYQYLVQSIQKFYDQQSLLQLVKNQGFKYSNFENLSQGIVAIHNGYKFQQ